jgi:hypothetical protein
MKAGDFGFMGTYLPSEIYGTQFYLELNYALRIRMFYVDSE